MESDIDPPLGFTKMLRFNSLMTLQLPLRISCEW